jgi:crotonobetainyl-CoA:carnitine CoA-transferase CaiB-like acyl-CoA transferase
MPEASAWPKFCKALGRDEWLDDERLQDARSRYRLMHELVPKIDESLSARGRDDWGKIFDEAGLIWGPVLALHEVVSDPQAEAINLFPIMIDDDIGEYRTVNIPMRFKSANVRPRGPAPRAGEHTRSVLAEAGFDVNQIEDLFSAGTVT